MRRRRFVPALIAFHVSVVGCNALLGIEERHLVDPGDASSDAGNSAGGRQNDGGGAEGGKGAGGGGTGGAGKGSGGRGTSDGGTGGAVADAAGDGGSETDAAVPDGSTDAGAWDPGTPPTGGGKVHCGGKICSASTNQVCCVGAAPHCAVQCSPNETTLRCDGDADCPSADCSVSIAGGGGPTYTCGCLPGVPCSRVACTGQDECSSNETCCFDGTSATCARSCSGTVLCHANAECGAAERCVPDVTPGHPRGLYACLRDPEAGRVRCGQTTCEAKHCCLNDFTQLEGICITECGAQFRIDRACDGDEDCPGQHCCLSQGPTGTGYVFACADTCLPNYPDPVSCGGLFNCDLGSKCCMNGASGQISGTRCAPDCAQFSVCNGPSDCESGQCIVGPLAAAYGMGMCQVTTP